MADKYIVQGREITQLVVTRTTDGDIMAHMVFPPKQFDFEGLYGQNARPNVVFLQDANAINYAMDNNNMNTYIAHNFGVFMLWNSIYDGVPGVEHENPILLNSGIMGYRVDPNLANDVNSFIALAHTNGFKVIFYCSCPGSWVDPNNQHQDTATTLQFMHDFRTQYNFDGWYMDDANAGDFMADYNFIRQLRSDVGPTGIIYHHDSLDVWDPFINWTTFDSTTHVFNTMPDSNALYHYTVAMRVTDLQGNQGTTSCTVTVYRIHRTGSAEVAYKTIQPAIDYAQDGDTIEVGDGTYSGPGNVNLHWNGSGANAKHLTLKSLNGPTKCIIDCTNTTNDPYRGFGGVDGNTLQNLTSADLISGFTIQNGSPTSNDYYGQDYGLGGGIYCVNSSVHIDNCIIANNQAVAGGGIAADANKSSTSSTFLPTITNCAILNNSASGYANGFSGGGIDANVIPTQGYSIDINNCTISGNTENGYQGGGICCSGGAPVISNSSITENQGYEGGGVYLTRCSGTLSKCVIAGNKSINGYGGGIYCDGGVTTTTLMDSCKIIKNSVDWATGTPPSPNVYGGGICCYGASPIIKNCIIANNVGDPAIADYGGGILSAYNNTTKSTSNPQIINCTFNNNIISDATSNGQSIYCYGSKASVINSIFWDTCNCNVSNCGTEIALTNIGTCPSSSCIPSCLAISYSDLKACGVSSGIYLDPDPNTDPNSDPNSDPNIVSYASAGSGMKNADPLFASSAADDYRLESGSPCFHQGTSSATYNSCGVVVTLSAPTTDIIGLSRDSQPSIGAYQDNPSAQTVSVSTDEHYGGHYTAIQRAIDWANNGDTVQLANGTYRGPCNKNLTWQYNSKAVTVQSWERGGSTIDCENTWTGDDVLDDAGTAFYLDFSSSDSPPSLMPQFTIDGLVIQNSSKSGKGGIYVSYPSGQPPAGWPVITNCWIQDCNVAGIYVNNGSPAISNCTVTGCGYKNGYFYPGYGGMYFITGGSPVVENCIVQGNYAGISGTCSDVMTGTCINENDTVSHLGPLKNQHYYMG